MSMKQVKNTGQPTSEESKNVPFESDAHKLSSTHLADEHHIISDEEMQDLRIGAEPPQKNNNAKNE